MLTSDEHNGQTYNLHGELMNQAELAERLSRAFGTSLRYRPMTVEAHRKERVAELGPFIGGVIAGIYEGIALGALDADSQFEAVAGRPHLTWDAIFEPLSRTKRTEGVLRSDV